MKAKFIGDPSDDFSGPKVLQSLGAYFPKDRFVGVTDAVAAKLKGNNHFEVEDGDAPAYAPSAEEVEAQKPAPVVDGGKALSKAEVLERLKAYPDAEYDPKAPVATLRAALEDAEFASGDD